MNNKELLARSKLTASDLPFEDGPIQGLSRTRLHFMLYPMKTELLTPQLLDCRTTKACGINSQAVMYRYSAANFSQGVI